MQSKGCSPVLATSQFAACPPAELPIAGLTITSLTSSSILGSTFFANSLSAAAGRTFPAAAAAFGSALSSFSVCTCCSRTRCAKSHEDPGIGLLQASFFQHTACGGVGGGGGDGGN